MNWWAAAVAGNRPGAGARADFQPQWRRRRRRLKRVEIHYGSGLPGCHRCHLITSASPAGLILPERTEELRNGTPDSPGGPFRPTHNRPARLPGSGAPSSGLPCDSPGIVSTSSRQFTSLRSMAHRVAGQFDPVELGGCQLTQHYLGCRRDRNHSTKSSSVMLPSATAIISETTAGSVAATRRPLSPRKTYMA